MTASNHHCSVVVVEGAGMLIEGSSGSGKTSLALGLVDTAAARGLKAVLVSDDQAMIEVRAGRLVASAPAAICGLAEIRGHGIASFPFQPACEVSLVARMVPDGEVARMPEPERTAMMGVTLPLVRLPERHEQQSVRILLAWLGEHRKAAAGRT